MKKRKQLLNILLVVCMLTGLFPVSAVNSGGENLPKTKFLEASGHEELPQEFKLEDCAQKDGAALLALTDPVSGNCGENLTWTLSTDGVLTISGTGPMTDYADSSKAPWYSYRASIRQVMIDSGVTNIGRYAFYHCDTLSGITIPDSVATIGNYAFAYCSSLTDVTIPNGVTEIAGYTFYDCTALTSVKIPDSVITIGQKAFSGCESLSNIAIPSGVTSIGAGAFERCSSITEIVIPDQVTTIKQATFADCKLARLFIPVGMKNAEYEAFRCTVGDIYYAGTSTMWDQIVSESRNSGLSGATKHFNRTGFNSGFCGEKVTWELSGNGTLTVSGSGSMWDHTDASDVSWYDRGADIKIAVIAPGVTNIGKNAFHGYTGLTSVTIPDSVTTIGESAFYQCVGLKDICYGGTAEQWGEISKGTDIGLHADATIHFAKTASGTCGESLIWTLSADGVLTISGEGDMYDYSGEIPAPWSAHTYSISSVVIGEGVTSIGERAFANIGKLETITIHEGITDVGFLAFAGCYRLEEINVTDENTVYSSIAGVLFSKDQTSLIWYPAGKSATAYTIPAGVMRIEPYAFNGASKLTSIVIPSGVTNIGNFAFVGCTGLTRSDIPASVASIGIGPFTNCKSLAEITVAEENTNYVTEKGVLYTADRTELIQYPSKKAGNVYAIPAGVTNVRRYAFDRCDNLMTILVPTSVAEIGVDVFGGCENLDTVKYAGTEQQWNAITIENGNDPFVSSERFYDVVFDTFSEDLIWAVTTDKTLTISGIGEMEDFDSASDVPWYEYRSSIKTVVVEDGVKSIGSNAFNGDTSLTNLTMTDDIMTIGDAAFSGCVWLSIELDLPEELVTIGEDAFKNCFRMTGTPVIPGDVTTIGAGAFYNCTKIAGELTLPNGLTEIGSSAFEICSGITSVTIPNTVTTIGAQAFFKCTALTYVQIPASVQMIGNKVFNLSAELRTVGPIGGGYNIEYGWTDAIPDNAFNGDGNIQSIAFPATLNTIGASAFYDCKKLTAIEIPDHITAMGENAFASCDNLASVTLGSGLTRLEKGVFSSCDSLADVNIPGTITTIGNSAFNFCRGLEKVTLRQGIQVIEAGAFSSCIVLKEIILPGTITNVGASAFSSLERVCFMGGPPVALGNTAFNLSATLYFFDSESWSGGWWDAGNHPVEGRYCEGITVKWGPDAGNERWDIFAIKAPEFTIQPQSQDVFVGETVTFTVAFTGTPMPAVQWQVNRDNRWTDIPDAVDSSYTTPAVTADDHGAGYRCVLVNYGGQVISDTAEVNVVIAVGTCGERLTWELTGDGVLTISGTGMMTDYNGATSGPWYEHRESITSVVVEEGVTSIGDWAFSGCQNITSIQIPDSVTDVGGGAFRSCRQLKTITVGDNNQQYCTIDGVLFDKTETTLICYPIGKENSAYVIPDGVVHIRYDAFRDCVGLTSITIPSSVISLGNSAFYGCRALTSIEIPSSVMSISGAVFSNCVSLTEITVASGNTYFSSTDGVLFNKNGTTLVAYPAGKSGIAYAIPDDVTSLVGGAFGGCVNLESITIPSGVTEIGAQMFENCSVLTEVVLPSGITTIGNDAFSWCTGLTNMTIPAGVREIGKYAFYKCGELKEITIPSSVQTIGEAAFAGCYALAAIYYDGSAAQWEAIEIGEYNSRLTSAKIYFAGLQEKIEVTIGNDFYSFPTLTWNEITGAEKYEIWRADGDGGFYLLCETEETEYCDTNAPAGTSYFYMVRAVIGDEKGEFSNIVVFRQNQPDGGIAPPSPDVGVVPPPVKKP